MAYKSKTMTEKEHRENMRIAHLDAERIRKAYEFEAEMDLQAAQEALAE